MWHEWSTLKKLIWLHILQGASAIIKTVTGTAPLVLTNAVNKAITELTQYGKCVQNGTPTPSAPADIVCNNGALRFGALGQNLFDPNPACITIGQNYNPEGVAGTSANNWRTGLIPIEGGKSYAFWGRKKSDNTMSAFNRINWFDADGNNISPRPSYTAYTVTVGTAPSNAAFVGLSCSCYNSSAAITRATFDEFNWMFVQADAEIAYEPFVGGIVADGTDEVLTVLANQNTDPTIVKVTLASSTTEVRYNASSSCIVAPVKPNTVYTIGFLEKPTGGSIFRAATTKTKVSSSVTSAASIAYDLDKNDYEPKTLNSGEDAAWMYVQLSNTMSADDFASIVIQEGTSIHNPQTASAVNLYSVGDVADEQNIISGGVTHKVGVKVLTGTAEDGNYGTVSTTSVFRLSGELCPSPTSAVFVCTHYASEDPSKSTAQMANFSIKSHASSARTWYIKDERFVALEDFQAYLSAQYAAGTPVIVIYPLAEETTESVTAQPLHTSAGDNTVSVTSNVDPVELEVQYSATA